LIFSDPAQVSLFSFQRTEPLSPGTFQSTKSAPRGQELFSPGPSLSFLSRSPAPIPAARGRLIPNSTPTCQHSFLRNPIFLRNPYRPVSACEILAAFLVSMLARMLAAEGVPIVEMRLTTRGSSRFSKSLAASLGFMFS